MNSFAYTDHKRDRKLSHIVSLDIDKNASPWDLLAEKNYQRIKKIGSGTFGTVYLGRCNLTNQNVAIKHIKLNVEDQTQATIHLK